MQSINSAMLNPLFLAVFLGTAAGCALVMVIALARWHSPGSVYLLVGGALYLVGSLLVTAVFNVPKNDALASVAPADPDSAGLWSPRTWSNPPLPCPSSSPCSPSRAHRCPAAPH